MVTTVLMIHRQLSFAISFKQALERAGAYQVHPFTAAGAAWFCPLLTWCSLPCLGG